MRAHAWGTRVFGFVSVVAMTLLAALLVSAAPSFAVGVAHDIPGTPMGPSGASGVVDVTTSQQDVYAVYLFAGQEVAFNAVWPNGYLYFGLYAPGTITVVGATAVSFGYGYDNDEGPVNVIDYTPAKSGTYYFRVDSPEDNGVTYAVTVQGTETMPLATTTALSGASKVKVKKMLAISGTVSPAESPGSVTMTKTHLVGTKWKSAGSTTLALVAGSFSYRFKPTLRGKWRLVAKYGVHTVGTTTYTSSKSAVKNVTVK